VPRPAIYIASPLYYYYPANDFLSNNAASHMIRRRRQLPLVPRFSMQLPVVDLTELDTQPEKSCAFDRRSVQTMGVILSPMIR